MQVKDIKSEGLSYEMEVTVPHEDIDRHIDAKLQQYGKTLKIPGFRPGKVPLNILKQRYGKMVHGEVLEQAVNDSTQKALNDKGLRPALQPKIEVKEFEIGKDLTYTMAVEVLPEFDLMDFKGLKLTKEIAKPSDKKIDEALERIAESNQDAVEVKRAAKEGDVVSIDFHGRTAKDNKEHEGMHAHDFDLELGSGRFIAGFEEQLVGKKAGDKVEVKVTFPEQYHSEELAGQDAIFDVKLKAVKEPKAPELNDEFAKKLGMEDMKAVRNAISEQLQKEYDNLSRLKLKREVLDTFDDNHDFPVPEGMMDMEFDAIKQQISIEEPEKVKDGKLQLDKEEEEELQAITERRVRLGMILSEIGRKNNIQVTDAEMQRAVIAEAQKYPGQEAQVFEYYRKNQQAQQALRGPVFEDKVVDFVLELAKIEDKEVKPEDLAFTEEDENYLKSKGKKKSSDSSKKSTAKKSTAKKSSSKKADEKKPAAKKETKSKSASDSSKKSTAKKSTKSSGSKKSTAKKSSGSKK